MIRRSQFGLEWLEFNILQQFPNISHGVFVKGSNEIGWSIDKDRFKCALSKIFAIDQIICPKICHGDQILEASAVNLSLPCDGFITNQQNMGHIITHADCQAAIFFDPKNNILANVHCGWRGNVQNIYAKTIEKMKACYGSDPKNIIVCISPSLGPLHAEFVNFSSEWPKEYWSFKTNRNFFDLWEISKMQLIEAGINYSNIEIAHMCSFENTSDFHSFRRDKTTLRNATLVALNGKR